MNLNFKKVLSLIITLTLLITMVSVSCFAGPFGAKQRSEEVADNSERSTTLSIEMIEELDRQSYFREEVVDPFEEEYGMFEIKHDDNERLVFDTEDDRYKFKQISRKIILLACLPGFLNFCYLSTADLFFKSDLKVALFWILRSEVYSKDTEYWNQHWFDDVSFLDKIAARNKVEVRPRINFFTSDIVSRIEFIEIYNRMVTFFKLTEPMKTEQSELLVTDLRWVLHYSEKLDSQGRAFVNDDEKKFILKLCKINKVHLSLNYKFIPNPENKIFLDSVYRQ